MFFLTINLIINTVLAKLSSEKRKSSLSGFFAVAFILSTISGLRYFVGTDYRQYREFIIFENFQTDWTSRTEPLFALILSFCRSVTDNPQFFFLITSFFINVLVVYRLYRESKYFHLSVYFYITTFIYYSTMNGIRQCMAAAIIFFVFPYVVEGKRNKYILSILLASLIHKSAIILIPLYYFVRKPIERKSNLIYLLIIAFIFIFYGPTMEILFRIMPQDSYGQYEEIIKEAKNGAHLLRLLVWSAPLILGFLYRKSGRKILGKKFDIIFNFCLLGWGFIFLSIRQVFFARMFMYLSFYYLLMIPLIEDLLGKHKRGVMLILMLLYFTYSTLLLLSGESDIYPFRMTLNIF